MSTLGGGYPTWVSSAPVSPAAVLAVLQSDGAALDICVVEVFQCILSIVCALKLYKSKTKAKREPLAKKKKKEASQSVPQTFLHVAQLKCAAPPQAGWAQYCWALALLLVRIRAESWVRLRGAHEKVKQFCRWKTAERQNVAPDPLLTL